MLAMSMPIFIRFKIKKMIESGLHFASLPLECLMLRGLPR
jgi:hypothetical protein